MADPEQPGRRRAHPTGSRLNELSCYGFLNTCPTEKKAMAATTHAGIAINGNPKNNSQPTTIGNSINTSNCKTQPTL